MERVVRRIVLLFSLLAAGCSHASAPVVETVALAPDLGPGDVFEVRVYGEEDLSGSYRVGSDGTINFPLVGKVEAEGRTAGEVSDAISQRLTKYIKNPSVSVFVKEYTSKRVYVLGQVQRPGTFPFEDGMNIIQAITLAGGFGQLADQGGTYVTRKVQGSEKRVDVSVTSIREGRESNFRLEPGDIVYVPESIF